MARSGARCGHSRRQRSTTVPDAGRASVAIGHRPSAQSHTQRSQFAAWTSAVRVRVRPVRHMRALRLRPAGESSPKTRRRTGAQPARTARPVPQAGPSARLAESAERCELAAEFDWITESVTDQFRHHGYCPDGDTTSFRSYAGSEAIQGDKLGTAHPSHRGLGVVAPRGQGSDGCLLSPPSASHRAPRGPAFQDPGPGRSCHLSCARGWSRRPHGGFGDRAPPPRSLKARVEATYVTMGQVPPFRSWQRWIRRRIEFAVRWAKRTSRAKTGVTALPTVSNVLAAVRRERGRLGLVALDRVQPPALPPAAPKPPPRRPVGALRKAAETIVRTHGPIDAASIAIMLDVRPPQIVGAFATSKVVRRDGGCYTLG